MVSDFCKTLDVELGDKDGFTTISENVETSFSRFFYTIRINTAKLFLSRDYCLRSRNIVPLMIIREISRVKFSVLIKELVSKNLSYIIKKIYIECVCIV